MTEAQAERCWAPPTGTLGVIVAEAAERAAALGDKGVWRARACDASPASSFAAALRGHEVTVIAEVKRRSPSRGSINTALSPALQAQAYLAGGAGAISVLTEPVHFGGAPGDIVAVVRAVSVPVLSKDFHVSPVQLFEARALGASAALLIVRAVPPDLLAELIAVAREVGLETLVEVRNAHELDSAVALGAEIIGANNRNLETLQLDGAASAVVPGVPLRIAAVAESGVITRGDVERAAAAGADAVLVGSMLSAAADPCAAVAALVGVPVTRERRPS